MSDHRRQIWRPVETTGWQRSDWCFIYSFSDSKPSIFFGPIRWMVSQILQLECEGTSAWYPPGQDTMHQIQMNFFRQSEFLLLFLFVIMLSLSFIISVVGNVYIYVWQPNISYFLKICLFFLFHAWFSFFKPNLFLNFLFFTFLNMMTWNPS